MESKEGMTKQDYLQIARIGFGISYQYLMFIGDGTPELDYRVFLANCEKHLRKLSLPDDVVTGAIQLSRSHLEFLTVRDLASAAVDHIFEGYQIHVRNAEVN